MRKSRSNLILGDPFMRILNELRHKATGVLTSILVPLGSALSRRAKEYNSALTYDYQYVVDETFNNSPSREFKSGC